MKDAARRAWLRQLLASGALGAAGLSGLIQRAQAMAQRPVAQGIQELKGDVRINKVRAKAGDLVNPGDTVTTGAESSVIFVIGQDSVLLRENSRLQIKGEIGTSDGVKTITVRALNLLRGKMLSVFGKGEKRIISPTATIGIRGTGVYVEVEPQRTYVCTCYGETVLEAKGSTARETIRTTHHEAPRYVYANRAPEAAMTSAPLINHTDDELTMLEALLGRSPPFAGIEQHRRY